MQSLREIMDIEKRKIFPKIKNWRSPQNKIRKSKSVKNLSYKEWFWLHPTAYQLMNYGVWVLGIIMSVIILRIADKNESVVGFVIGLVLLCVYFYGLFKRISNHKLHFNTTFYDIWMREYDEVAIIDQTLKRISDKLNYSEEEKEEE